MGKVQKMWEKVRDESSDIFQRNFEREREGKDLDTGPFVYIW